MKLQHNSSGESSEDLIALIIAVRREREREQKRKAWAEGERRKKTREAEEKKGSSGIEELERETDVAGVSRCSSVCTWACVFLLNMHL